jgi:hypothetical protein
MHGCHSPFCKITVALLVDKHHSCGVLQSLASLAAHSDLVILCRTIPDASSAPCLQVERFLVVHGQIILNQFKHYPIKSVQRCAFTGQLKERMEARRHAKLYLSKRKITVEARRDRKLNPMRNRTPAFKPVPMTATATHLVKEVWLDYFKGASADAGADPCCAPVATSARRAFTSPLCALTYSTRGCAWP